jgi:2'-5' RNA ligase
MSAFWLADPAEELRELQSNAARKGDSDYGVKGATRGQIKAETAAKNAAKKAAGEKRGQEKARAKGGGTASGEDARGNLHGTGEQGGQFVSKGSTGKPVEEIQKKIGETVTGSYDANTAASVVAFQRKHGLVADGIVGRQTALALQGQFSEARKVGPGKLGPRTSRMVGKEYVPSPGTKAAKAAKGKEPAKKKARPRERFGGGVLVEADVSPTSTMVALYPSPTVAQALAVPGGEAADEIHLTLAFLGDLQEDQMHRVINAVQKVARYADLNGVVGKIAGPGTFLADQQKPVHYASVDAPALPALRSSIMGRLKSEGVGPREDHGFTPHMTLRYGGAPVKVEPQTVRFEDLRVVQGNRVVASAPLRPRDEARLAEGGAFWLSPFELLQEKVIGSVSWDEALHPRNEHGRFVKNLLSDLKAGDAVSLDAKTTIGKDKDGTYRVTRSGGITKGFKTAADAARDALDKSAKGTEADSIGGATKFKDYNAYLAARGLNPMKSTRFGGVAIGFDYLDKEVARLTTDLQQAKGSDDKYVQRSVKTLEARLAEAKAKRKLAASPGPEVNGPGLKPLGGAGSANVAKYGPPVDVKKAPVPGAPGDAKDVTLPAENDLMLAKVGVTWPLPGGGSIAKLPLNGGDFQEYAVTDAGGKTATYVGAKMTLGAIKQKMGQVPAFTTDQKLSLAKDINQLDPGESLSVNGVTVVAKESWKEVSIPGKGTKLYTGGASAMQAVVSKEHGPAGKEPGPSPQPIPGLHGLNDAPVGSTFASGNVKITKLAGPTEESPGTKWEATIGGTTKWYSGTAGMNDAVIAGSHNKGALDVNPVAGAPVAAVQAATPGPSGLKPGDDVTIHNAKAGMEVKLKGTPGPVMKLTKVDDGLGVNFAGSVGGKMDAAAFYNLELVKDAPSVPAPTAGPKIKGVQQVPGIPGMTYVGPVAVPPVKLDLAVGDLVQKKKGAHKLKVVGFYENGTPKLQKPNGGTGWVANTPVQFVEKADGSPVKLKEPGAAPAPAPVSAPVAGSPAASGGALTVKGVYDDLLGAEDGLSTEKTIGDYPDGAVIGTPSGKVMILQKQTTAPTGYVSAVNVQTGELKHLKADAAPKKATGPSGAGPAKELLAKAKAQQAAAPPTSAKAAAAKTAGGGSSTDPNAGGMFATPEGSIDAAWHGLPENAQAKAVFSKHMSDNVGGLSGSHKLSISSYTGSGYQPINKFMRHKWTTEAERANGEAKAKELLAAFDALGPIGQETIVYRKVTGKTGEFWKHAPVDATLPDMAFGSASSSPQFAHGWGGGGNGTLLKIKLPADQKGMWVSGGGGTGTLSSVGSGESELVLPPGMHFKVLETRTLSSGQVMHVVVPVKGALPGMMG